MRKPRKRYFIEEKKLMMTTIFSMLIVAILVLSSLVIGIHIQGNQEKMNVKKVVEIEKASDGLPPGNSLSTLSTGLAPTVINMESQSNGDSAPLSLDPTMYAYVAYASGLTNGPCYFATGTPGTITKLSEEQVTNFLAGGTWSCDGKWLCCQYGTGVLYQVTTDTGKITLIGGGGVNLNGLAYDPTTNLMYGAGDTALYRVNAETGAQELVGDFGSDVLYMIGMAFDSKGVLYGWDLNDYLWTINTNTGDATQVGPLGINLNYAQDGDFDRENDVLYLTAWTLSPNYGSYLYTCNKETGACTLVGPLFGGGAEIDASMFMSTCVSPEHDVGVKSIDLPVDGCAHPDMDMQVTVKNYGTNTEITDVQMEILKLEAGPTLLTEDFSGTFPPTGWTHYGYVQSNTNKAGGTLPEAFYTYTSYLSNGWIMTPPIDCTGYDEVNVKFRLYGDFSIGFQPFFYLQYRNADSSWNTVSPWDNPVSGDLGPACYEIACYEIGCRGKDIGAAFQVRWYFGSYYYYLQYGSGIYLDDVEIQGYTSCAEYSSLVKDVEVPYGGEVIVDEFDKWTPSDWGDPAYECSDVTYYVTAFTLLEDGNPWNDCKSKEITLHFDTPPEITLSGNQIVLWPPNHKYQTIKISDFIQSVTDICDANVGIDDVIITSVSSDEPENAKGDGDGNTWNDIVILDAQTVQLRAEREGVGNGRVYTINFEVTDLSGNTATGCCKIWVPHDQGAHSTAIDDGASAGYTVYYP